jgi:hypothetical protein
MSKHLTSHVIVDAPPEVVWSVLCDFSAYAKWNPFIVEAVEDGDDRLQLRMQPEGGRAVTLKPRVLERIRAKRLRWRGRLAVPGIFDADHTFELEPHGSGTRLTQKERFSGVLVPLFAGKLARQTLPAFVAMNEALKVRAEAAASARA